MPDKEKMEHCMEEVEKSVAKQISDLLTFLTEPRAVAPVYESIMAMVERSILKTALERNGNIKTKTAEFLGINRNFLQTKIIRLGLEEKREPKNGMLRNGNRWIRAKK